MANNSSADSHAPKGNDTDHGKAQAASKRRRDLRERYRVVESSLEAAERSRNPVEAKTLQRELDAIGREFVITNRGLAGVVARRYFTSGGESRRDDYVSSATVGLWEAFLKWDPDQSTFGNFSRRYIEGRVRRSVSAEEFTETSYGDFTARPAVTAAIEALTEKLGRVPDDAEVSKEAGLPVTLVERVRRPRVGSLDAVVGQGNATLGDLVAATDDVELDEVLEHEMWLRNLTRVAGQLTPRELFVVMRRTQGLDAAPAQTLVEIAALTGLGREILRRTEVTARKKASKIFSGLSIG